MLLAAWRPDFYAAAASIIPVLLISIALQERYFRTLYWLLGGRKLRTGVARVDHPNHRHRGRELWRRWWIDPPPSDPKQVKPPPPPPPILRRVVAVLASLSFLGGGVAEILALRSLWYGHDYFGWFVFFMIAVLLGPNIIGLSMAVLGMLDPESWKASVDDD